MSEMRPGPIGFAWTPVASANLGGLSLSEPPYFRNLRGAGLNPLAWGNVTARIQRNQAPRHGDAMPRAIQNGTRGKCPQPGQ